MQCPHCFFESEVPRAFWGQPVVCPNCSGQFIVSADTFDPYYAWLGIPPTQQPPNFYRLLGIQLFEPNLDVIENAADRQMAHVRSYQLGPRSAESQRLLNEIASARVALLDPFEKDTYDDQLRRTFAPAVPAPHYQAAYAATPAVAVASHSAPIPPRTVAPPEPPPATPPARSFETAQHPQPLVDSGVRLRSSMRHRRSQSTGMLTPFMIVVGAIVGLGLGALIIFYITGVDYLGLSNKFREQFDQNPAPPNSPSLPKAPSNRKGPSPSRPVPGDPRRSQNDPQQKEPGPIPIAVAPAPVPVVAPAPAGAFPKTVELPDLTSREPAVLAQIPGDPADPVEFTLHGGLAALPAKTQLVGETNAESGDFLISYVPAPDAEMVKIPLATLRRDETQLVFRWADSPADPAVRRQVRNCLLELSIGGEFRKLQLREPLVAPRLEVDLEDDKQEFEIEIEDLPKLGRIRLASLNLANFEGGQLRGGTSVCEFSKSVFVDFEKMKGPQIEIQLLQQPKTKSLLIKQEGLFRESANRKFELSFHSLDKAERAQQKVLSEANAARSQAQSLLTNAQTRLQQLLANPPAPALQGPWQAEIAACRTTIAAAPKTFERLDAQITESNARLAAVPAIRGFISSLHKKATIEYLISAVDGDDELVLARKPGIE
jgi:hypothetical protein